jgi:DNA-directed RNA polymerase sigma subunit (sigma70/sigma32)
MPMTPQEVAEELDIPTVEVRKIERRAIGKLRKWCEERGLTAADLPPPVVPTDIYTHGDYLT